MHNLCGFINCILPKQIKSAQQDLAFFLLARVKTGSTVLKTDKHYWVISDLKFHTYTTWCLPYLFCSRQRCWCRGPWKSTALIGESYFTFLFFFFCYRLENVILVNNSTKLASQTGNTSIWWYLNRVQYCEIFQMLDDINKTKEFNMGAFLSHSVSFLPWSLVNFSPVLSFYSDKWNKRLNLWLGYR